jgi:hypothetical protein
MAVTRSCSSWSVEDRDEISAAVDMPPMMAHALGPHATAEGSGRTSQARLPASVLRPYRVPKTWGPRRRTVRPTPGREVREVAGERSVCLRGTARLSAALAGAGAVVAGVLLPLSLATTAPAGASSVPAQDSASATSGLGPIVSDVETLVVELSLSNLGSYIEGHTQCPVSEVGYLLAGVPGPPPCAPGQIGG